MVWRVHVALSTHIVFGLQLFELLVLLHGTVCLLVSTASLLKLSLALKLGLVFMVRYVSSYAASVCTSGLFRGS